MHFAVEKLQQSVQFLKKIDHPEPEFKMGFYPLDKHVTPEQLTDIVHVLQKGHDVGVISEAGCPGIADPGAELVWMCHGRGIAVEPLVGPSAITMSVMASGLNGQQFAFNGYLPFDKEKRNSKIGTYEGRSANDNQTQVFIEAPFRNSELLKAMMDVLSPDTKLCICWNMMAEDAWMCSKEVTNWGVIRLPDEFDRKPAMFLFLAPWRQKSGGNEGAPARKSKNRGVKRNRR